MFKGFNFVFYLFLILLGTNFSFSVEDAGDDNYNDPNFYENTDAGDIDWSLADVSKVPPKVMEKVPAEKAAEGFDVLSDEQKKEMTPDQIAESLDKISDLSSEVDPNRAEQALKEKLGLDVKIDGSLRLVEGKLMTPEGNEVSSDEEIYKQGLVNVDKNGEIELILDEEVLGNKSEITNFQIPEGDSFNLNTEGNFYDFGLGDKEVNLAGYFKVGSDGSLELVSDEFRDGTRINGISLFGLNGDENLKVSLDENDAGKLGVLVLADSEIGYVRGSSSSEFTFTVGDNNFFENSEQLGPSFGITTDVDGLNIISRKSEGLVPIVDVELSEGVGVGEGLLVSNGPLHLTVGDEMLIKSGSIRGEDGEYIDIALGNEDDAYLERFKGLGQSFPMRLEVGKSDSSETYLMSGFNEIFALGDKNDLLIEDGTQDLEGYQSSYSETLSFVGEISTKKIEERFGIFMAKLVDENDEIIPQNPVALKRTYDILDNLPSNVLESVGEITLMSDESWSPQLNDLFGYIPYGSTDELYLRESKGGVLFPDHVIYHELTHLWDFSKFEDPMLGYGVLMQKTGMDPSMIPPGIDTSELDWDSTQGLGFSRDWVEIHGEDYGKYTDSEKGGAYWKTDTLSDISGDETGPGYGCFRAYGCSKVTEDVATMIEHVFDNPDFYKPLISQSNPDSRYIKKLALAHEYGLIPKSWLGVQMESVGYDRICIDDVTNSNGYESECIQ